MKVGLHGQDYSRFLLRRARERERERERDRRGPMDGEIATPYDADQTQLYLFKFIFYSSTRNESID